MARGAAAGTGHRGVRARAGGSLQIVVASVLWGTTGTAQALAPAGVTPAAIASVRLSLGGAALVVVAAALRAVPVRGLALRPVCVAAACLVVAQLSFFTAVDRTGVAIGTVVAIGSSPIAAGVLTWLRGDGIPGRKWWVATALAVAGCVLLLTAGRAVEVDAAGVGLALVVGLGYAGYTLTTKDLVGAHAPHAVTAEAAVSARLSKNHPGMVDVISSLEKLGFL